MKKLCIVLIVLFSILFKSHVYASNVEDEIFLCIGEKYVIEQQEGVLSTYTSENEEIAAMEEQMITGISSGETYIVINNEDNTEKKLHVFVGDYKLCLGQEKPMEFNLSSVINAWDSSARSSDTSVVSVKKQGYEGNYASFLFKAFSTGMTNITISKGSSVLKSFTVVVQEHALVYCEQIEPTCSQKGSIAYYKCLFCNKYFSDSDGQELLEDVSIDEIEHDYIINKMKEATCSEDGYVEYVCQSCEHKVTQQLLAEHMYESQVVKPNCINEGYTIYTCNKCGASYRDLYVDALGHNYIIVSYTNYNCIIQKKCTICGNITYEMNIEGMMINQSFYQRYWQEELSYYYVPLNQENLITSSFSSTVDTNVLIKYKCPIRNSSGKLKIYDIKMIYKDRETNQVRYDNAINCISFSYYDDDFPNRLKTEVGHGISQCELEMDYDVEEDDDDGFLFYSYYPFEDIGNKYYLILGVTFKLQFQSDDTDPYKKIAIQDVVLSKDKLTILKGFSKELKVLYDHRTEYIDGLLQWKSSDKKIATVNSSGEVTAKKAGKCTITCQLPNGRKASCKINVVKNEYKGKSLSKCNAYSGRYGNIHFTVNKAYYKGNKFVLKCVVMNTRIFRAEQFNWVTISAKDAYGHVIAKKKFNDVSINLDAYGKKYITFTFPKSAVKKIRDLRKGVRISTNYSCQYSY